MWLAGVNWRHRKGTQPDSVYDWLSSQISKCFKAFLHFFCLKNNFISTLGQAFFFFKIANYEGIKMLNNLSEFWLHKGFHYCERTYFFKNYKDFKEDFISADWRYIMSIGAILKFLMKTKMHLFLFNLRCSLWNCHYSPEPLFKFHKHVQVEYFLEWYKYNRNRLTQF